MTTLPPKRLGGGVFLQVSAVGCVVETGEEKEEKRNSKLGQVEIRRGPGQFGPPTAGLRAGTTSTRTILMRSELLAPFYHRTLQSQLNRDDILVRTHDISGDELLRHRQPSKWHVELVRLVQL